LASYGSVRRACARFGCFQVDLNSSELFRSGVRVPIQEQPFQVLRLLLEAEGKVVTREQLRAALWSENTFVDFEHGVNTAVKKLRQALEDSAESPKFVETLPKLGYRFIFPVEWVADPNSKIPLPRVVPIAPPGPIPVSQPAPRKRNWKLRSPIALTALAVMTSAVFLSNENSHLSHTRVGMMARRLLVGDGAETRSTVTERRLTANPADVPVTGSVISPDGKYLAYTDKTGFYLRQVDTGETHPVPLPKGFEPIVESWLPDSDHLVVSWVRDSKEPSSLWEISVMGGTPRKLVDEGSSARVSPDGSKIAFLRYGVGRNEIWLMQADGGGAHRIVGGTAAQQENFSPVAWAPDGRRAAYVRTTVPLYNAADQRAVREIEIADISSGQFGVVLSNPGLENALGWTHNNFLAYSLREPSPNQNDFGLWRMQLDSQTAHPMGTRMRLTSGRGLAAELSVSSDGKSLAFRGLEQQTDVYIADLEAGGKRLATPKRLTLDDRGDFVFSWTPDSKAVLFLSDRDGPLHLFRQAIDQTQPELLVGGNDALAIPRLNSSGTEVLYLVMPKQGQSSNDVRIMRVPLAGGPSQFVLEAPGIWNQQCARLPSTLCIYSPREPDQQRFFSFDPVTGASAEILSASIKGAERLNWSLSPDGKYLAMRILRINQDAAIRIFSIADGSERTIPVLGWPGVKGVDWAADGNSLWAGAITRNSSSFEGPDTCPLLRIDLDGKIRSLIEKGDVCFWAAIPSPDGHRLALEGAKPDSSNVWLLENF
jgi:Tol biopolymer transport system component/DNA-binding winged helix-turn-helix (wHTH) protein